MHSTISLINKLKSDYPNITFKKSAKFAWSFEDKTIFYNDKLDNYQYFLFHELAHAILNHANYTQDIELISMERNAWDKAGIISKKYQIDIDDDFIQTNLDTYRDWLHQRSLCPNCGSNGLQTKNSDYHCLACNHKWRVNQAKDCALRRYEINKKTCK